MNTIKIYRKVNGEYVEIDGVLVSLESENLLDEQLDQARAIIKKSAIELLPPLTDIKIEYYSNGYLSDVECFIVGDDKPTEYIDN